MYTDNSQQIMKDVAQFILDNAPSGMPLYDLTKLQSVVNGKFDDRDHLYIEFKSNVSDAASTNATLYVRRTMMRGGFSPYKTDEEGNEWAVGAITTEVNWPCHGSADVPACKSRLEFYGSVVSLAEVIEKQFGGTTVYELVATKAQRDEEETQRTYGKAARAVLEAIKNDPVRKHMRVGADRQMYKPIEAPPGTYTVSIKEKTYEVTVYSPSPNGIQAFIKRTA